ncbi:MAG: DNA polymerase Y family protein [Terracidiphilus sp.]|jgi:protein ImuB
MRRELYACAYAAEFPAQALLRLRPDLASEPVAVLEGRAPQETICALNQKARLCGAVARMTRLEAEGIARLKLLARSMEGEAAARKVFLESVAQFSPRIEEESGGIACAFVLDIAGTERLFGPPERLAQRLRAALNATGFRASIAVSTNYHAARMKAAHSRGITIIAEGTEANALGGLPVGALGIEPEQAETFAFWGIRTLGELAALPEAELVVRLGANARAWSALARGAADHIFRPIEPALSLEEFCELEAPVEQSDALLFLGARMIDCLATRAAARALSLASLKVRMKLEGGGEHERVIRPALPTTDRKFLLKLLQLEIAAHPPPAAVIALTLAAEAGQSSQVQLGLFAPQMPEPSRLDVTLARLKAIVGDDRVGSPVLEDTHRADSFRMKRFTVDGKMPAHATQTARIALRRVRPPTPVSVELHAMKPVAFRDREHRFEVTDVYGPWRTAGFWWSVGMWDGEEWDVLAMKSDGTSVACVLTCDRARTVWRLEAVYD